MGEASSIIAALGGCGCCKAVESCNKYTLNACHLSSRCSDCCEFDIQTEEIPLSDSEEEFEAGCLSYHHK